MDDVSLAEKQCKSCLEIYPATPKYFNKKKTGRYGFMGICKACRSERRNPGSTKAVHIKARMLAPDGYIKCVGCGNVVPEDREHVQWNERDGFYSRCLPCHNVRGAAASRKYAANHPEKVLQAARNEYKKRKEEKPEYLTEKSREAAKRWREKNRELYRQRCREWAQRNPEKLKAQAHKRRSWKVAAQGHHTAEDLARMFIDQAGLCCYCEVPMGARWTVDHMIPLSRGGSNNWDNIGLCCGSCNRRKNARTAEEYMLTLD